MLGKIWRERARARAARPLTAPGALAEPGLNRVVEQVANAFAAPVALLTILHDRRLLVGAGVGVDLWCMPREDSFCHHAVDRNDLLEVCDALADPLFRTLPCVAGAPYIRYYLGAPLTLAGDVDVGMLCVLDVAPRPPASRDQRAYLSGLARQAAHAIERRTAPSGSFAA